MCIKYSLAASAGIEQSDYRRVGGVGGRLEGKGDERTNLSSMYVVHYSIECLLYFSAFLEN